MAKCVDVPARDGVGLCVEIEERQVRRASVRGEDHPEEVAGLAGQPLEHGWVLARVGPTPLEVRVTAEGIEARGGEVVTQGPCFWK